MPPTAPCDEGVLTTIRPAFISAANSLIRASSFEKMLTVCPMPPWKFKSMHRLAAERKSSATYQARMGARISDDNGHWSPMPPSGATSSSTSAGRSSPAIRAIFAAGCPTTSGAMTRRFASNAIRPTWATSASERK